MEDKNLITPNIYLKDNSIYIGSIQVTTNGYPKFNNRELDIVRRRLKYPKDTYPELAQEYNGTKQRVQQIYTNAIKKIKQRYFIYKRLNS